MLDRLARPSVDTLMRRHGLTRRQGEVALLLADRLSTKEIARRLGVRFDTARRHVQAVLRRLHVNGRDEVADAIGKVVDIRAFFEGGTDVQVTFVLKTRSDGTLLRHDPHRSSMRFRPASTFKIPNTVIGLETGVVAGPDHVFPFHPDLVPEVGFFARSWRSDHTLESAFRNSVYWYYQEVARRVGRVRMQAWLDAFGYGNREMGDEVDSFWLHGDLRISAIEQVRFLSDLLEGRFDVSRPTLESLTEISILEEGDGWKLHGKTGTSNVTPTRENGWLVGWVDAAEQRWYYALNMEGERVWEDWPPGARADLVLRILAHVGVPVEASRTGPDPTEQDGVG